ncbi:MAG: hypothetical protein A4E59_00326 [Syntrophorhabdus sp. PtaB.Bin027]|nr:MAG: hypothetical protein A4E59_00326 [Syntrophorhabdus sp. PtaB.Bin027]
MIPARNNLPIDNWVTIPKTINTTLGGINTPSVPTVATIPVDSFLAYPNFVISGTATLANVADVAATDPHIALNAVAPATVAIARPPGIWPRNLCAQSKRRLAIPALNAIWPISTKSGITVSP